MKKDLIPCTSIDSNKYFSEEGYMRNKVPRDVRIFHAFRRAAHATNNSEIRVNVIDLEQAATYYTELQKKCKDLEEKLKQGNKSTTISKLLI